MHLMIWLKGGKKNQKNPPKPKALTEYLLIFFLMTSFLQFFFSPSFPPPVIKFKKVYGNL